MRLLIDGDACPDRQKVIELALHYGVEVLLFIDFAHVIEDERIQIIMCEVGKDSVDQMILSYLQEGDLLISQDYGLASLALLKNVTILHVSGKRITEDNINNLLTSRYLGHLSRKQHKHVKGPKKRNVYNKGKNLLRHAFEGTDYLPHDILFREKAAFSDAVGHSMVDYLKELAEDKYSDEDVLNAKDKYSYCTPFTKESLMYRDIFESFFPQQGKWIKDFWMPNKEWENCDVDDPSARVLKNYGDSGK